MSTSTHRESRLRKAGLAVAAASALIAVGVPLAAYTSTAAPAAAPQSDGEGYVNSTARCTAPSTAVMFGTTETSRVAICQTASGTYQYRGVRVSDGARLVTTASKTSSDAFVANNDGVTYTVTPTALSVTASGNTFRTETWTDYNGPEAPASTATSTSTSTAASTSATPSTSGTASPSTTTSAAETSTAQTTSTVPLPPPLSAE
ncbi:MAG: hypothetical protein K0U67_00550, partial [Actinomycetia bacterium]|nr:hypothetical protein [Actinomycetes bacterium]